MIVRSILAFVLLVSAAMAAADATAPVRSLLEMRQERVVVQQWDLSCGAAALTTLLKYQYGEAVTEHEIALQLFKREEYLANPSLVAARQGFSLLDLKRITDARGYNGIGLGNLKLHDLIARAPLIVPISLHGYNHFVVFRGALNGQVLLADPAWGNRTMPVETFDRVWIEYPEIGKLGFSVALRDGTAPPNRLAPQLQDFVLLR
jgi:hypothetical protein